MTSVIPRRDYMSMAKLNDQLTGFEDALSASLMKFRFDARLPSDFLEKGWVRIFRMILGPIHPGYVIGALLFVPFGVFVIAASLWLWLFASQLLLLICISILVVGVAVILADNEYRVPDRRQPFEEIKKNFEARDTTQGVVFLVGLVFFSALAVLVSGWAALPVALLFFVAGITASFLYLAAASRVFQCTQCNRPSVFRKFHGRWSCVACGLPR